MKRRRTPLLPLLLLLAAAAPLTAAAAATPDSRRPEPADPARASPGRCRRSSAPLLISIDGCRPDLLLRAKTPNVHQLMESGSYTFWARTVPVAVTLPSHASMLTGVTPEKHGITQNKQVDEDSEVAHPKVPTVFEIAMRYGMTTAVVAGKSKFDTFARVGHVDRSWTEAAKDAGGRRRRRHDDSRHRPDLMLVHFPGADKAGHGIGWASPEQVAALEGIDAQIGKLLAALDELQLRDKTVILLTADHGGQGRGHGISSGGMASPDDPRSQHIPWILSGPGIRKNYDLSQDPRLHVRTMDTFATLCFLLGLQPDGPIDGKPITLAVEEPQQLLQDAEVIGRTWRSSFPPRVARCGSAAGGTSCSSCSAAARVIAHTVAALLAHDDVGLLVLATNQRERIEPALADPTGRLDPRITFCPGGASRRESVLAALRQVPETFEWVAVHDAARPLVSPELIERTLAAARQYGAAVPALPIALTVKQATGPLPARVERTIPRQTLWAMQTPQVMRRADLLAAYDACPLPLGGGHRRRPTPRTRRPRGVARRR